MALLNKVYLTTQRFNVDMSKVYIHLPSQFVLKLRQICAKLVEAAFLGPNPQEPFQITTTMNPENEVDYINLLIFFNDMKTKADEMFSQCQGNLQKPHDHQCFNCFDIRTLQEQLESMNFLADARPVIEIYRQLEKILQDEIGWLTRANLNNPPEPFLILITPTPSPTVSPSDLEIICKQVEDPCQKIIIYTDKLSEYRQISMAPGQNQPNLYQNMQPEYEQAVSLLLDQIQETITSFVNNYIAIWKHRKQHEIIGIPTEQPSSTLELILVQSSTQLFQNIFTILEKLSPIRNDLANHPNLIHNIFPSSNLFSKILNIFQNFMSGTFLVVKPPPLVVPQKVFMNKEYLEEPITVSFLVSHPTFNFGGKLPEVRMSLITQEQAKKIHLNGTGCVKEILSCGDLGVFENDKATLTFSNLWKAEFTRPKLLTPLRNGRESGNGNGGGGGGNDGTVMEQKCAILFTFSMQLFGHNLTVWTMSSPVCVSTHVSQRGLGMAVIIRDYLTANVGRIPFAMPHDNPKVISWAELSQVILILFKEYLDDRELNLTEENWICIKNKVAQAIHPELQTARPEVRRNFRLEDENIQWKDLGARIFQRLQNLADPEATSSSSNDSFSFWGWLCEAFDVLKVKPFHKDMVKMWKNNLIVGFIEKSTAEEKLKASQKPGTFLLRFSDRLPGAISIAEFKNDGRVHHLNPFTKKDLQGTPLADKLRAFVDLTHFYGSGPKDECLQDFYSRRGSNSNSGYKFAVSSIG